MSGKKRTMKILKYIPNKFKTEIFKRRRSTPFLISLSFLISLVSARLWVIFLKADGRVTEDVSYMVGRNVVLGGYHVHHIVYGIILLSISSWLAINYWSKSIARISSILYGTGLGLIVDEVGFIIGGIEPYRGDREVFYIAVAVIGILASIVYFPSFYRAMKRDIKRLKGRFSD